MVGRCPVNPRAVVGVIHGGGPGVELGNTDLGQARLKRLQAFVFLLCRDFMKKRRGK